MNLFNKKLIKNEESPSWAEFSIGYIYFKEGNLKASFSKALKSMLKLNPTVSFKSLLLIILIFKSYLKKNLKNKKKFN